MEVYTQLSREERAVIQPISRELMRNSWIRPKVSGPGEASHGRGLPGGMLLKSGPRCEQLNRAWKAVYLHNAGWRVHTQVIGWLRFSHVTRRTRARGENRRGRILDMDNIHCRPPEAWVLMTRAQPY